MASRKAKRLKAPQAPKTVRLSDDLDHHRIRCTICRHPQREEIERDFIDWLSPRKIAENYKLGSHSPVHRHARAYRLFDKRRRNVLSVLDRIVEHVDEIKPSSSSVVSAVRLMVDINTQGEWFERRDRIYLREIFDQMTREELDLYAREGNLPERFNISFSAAAPRLPALPAKRTPELLPSNEKEPTPPAR